MSFSFYRADAAYCDFLRESDPCVPYTMDKKNTRPFVGIVFSMNGYNYYAPLTSPKPKHLTMKNQIDFLKINGGAWGAINFNNMIPIHTDSLQPIDIKILPTDDKATIDYKNLLANQLSWCNTTENMDLITAKAQKLYHTITSKTARPQLVERCCNFSVDEAQFLVYCNTHNKTELEAEAKQKVQPPQKMGMKERMAVAQAESDRRSSSAAADRPHNKSHNLEK